MGLFFFARNLCEIYGISDDLTVVLLILRVCYVNFGFI